VEGLNLTYKYCDEHNIAYKKCGKLIVATDPVEEMRLHDLYERGKKNNVKDLQMISAKMIKEIEPYCQVKYGFSLLERSQEIEECTMI
jgi:2-hydroxyglutarate dehydrogenase